MSTEKKRILLIDDDENILTTLQSYLSKIGYATDIAKNGNEAIGKCSKAYFNLAIIDLILPDMLGTQLIVKMDGNLPRMRKIILTGHATLDNAIEALNLGADAYLMKPVNPKELLRVIEEQLLKQQEESTMTQDKISEFVNSKIKQREEEKFR
jgi:DNA-binding response OmpR family regulator